MMPLNLEFSHVQKRFGKKIILNDEQFCIRGGELNLICGKNGTGKTTLLRIIAGLEKPDKAQIDMGSGTSTWRRCRKQLQQLIVYLHQYPYMFDCNVKKNLAYALHQRNLTMKEKKNLIDAALDLAQIEDIATRHARTLSGGEQQRVALVRAWLRQPSVMLLDEPTANMDQESRKRTVNLLHKLKIQGLALLVASHDPDQFNGLANNTLHMSKGALASIQPSSIQSTNTVSVIAA